MTSPAWVNDLLSALSAHIRTREETGQNREDLKRFIESNYDLTQPEMNRLISYVNRNGPDWRCIDLTKDLLSGMGRQIRSIYHDRTVPRQGQQPNQRDGQRRQRSRQRSKKTKRKTTRKKRV